MADLGSFSNAELIDELQWRGVPAGEDEFSSAIVCLSDFSTKELIHELHSRNLYYFNDKLAEKIRGELLLNNPRKAANNLEQMLFDYFGIL